MAAAFADLIEELHMAYPDATYSWRGKLEGVVSLWERAFSDIPPEVVMVAARRWIATEPKLPHISELRALIANAVAPVPSQAEAYASGLRWIRERSLRDEDAFGVEVMKSLGDRKVLGQMKEEDLRREFGFAYRTMAAEERTQRTASVDMMLAERSTAALEQGD